MLIDFIVSIVNKNIKMTKMIRHFLILVFLGQNLVFAQVDSTFVDTVSNRYTFMLSENVFSNPQQGNSLLSDGCATLTSGTDSYHLRTGYMGYDETATELGDFELDLDWEVISDPCNGIDVPFASAECYTLTMPDYYGEMGIDIDGSGAPYDDINVIRPGGGCASNYGEYIFQTTFCLSSDAAGIELNLKCLSDNNATVYLNGVEIASQGFIINGWALDHLIDASITDVDPSDDLFVEGVNELRVKVINLGMDNNTQFDQSRIGETTSSVLLGLYANIEVSNGCVSKCNKTGAIWGVKHNDLNADGVLQEGEPPLAGVDIELYSEGSLVATTTTDEFGLFLFTDLDAGTYTVKEPAYGSWTCTYPSGAEHTGLVLEEFSVINNLRFLNTEYDQHLDPCDDCGDSFAPIPGEKYWISAWVQVDGTDPVKSYNDGLDGPFLRAIFPGTSEVIPEFYPTGEIIDGWQRVVGSFVVPMDATNFLLTLNADPDTDTYFDDIRVHPFNGSMKSYVYDGETFWLVSELDDNNYATFYEYDEEGGLIRIKKETSRGIVTIQETGSNTQKRENTAE